VRTLSRAARTWLDRFAAAPEDAEGTYESLWGEFLAPESSTSGRYLDGPVIMAVMTGHLFTQAFSGPNYGFADGINNG
jgi:hypothetical protein